MDTTNISCFSNQCVGKNVRLEGAGGYFSCDLNVFKLECPECSMSIAIVPMTDEFKYEITAHKKY